MWITNASAMEIKLPDLLAFFSLMSAWIGIFDWNIVLILRAGKATTNLFCKEEFFVVLPELPSYRKSVSALRKARIVLAPHSSTGNRKQLPCSCSHQQMHSPKLHQPEQVAQFPFIWHGAENGKYLSFTSPRSGTLGLGLLWPRAARRVAACSRSEHQTTVTGRGVGTWRNLQGIQDQY